MQAMTSDKWIFRAGGTVLWAVAFVVILIVATWSPDTRSVVGVYRRGSEMFLARSPLYDLQQEMGYLYAPAFAALFVPFFKLGPYLGDALWRILGFAVLTYAAVRQVRRVGGKDLLPMLSLGLLVALPVTAGAIRNGQATILLTGACWLLTLSALENRRAETLLWATLALVAKPTAIVMLLLVGALRPRLIGWLLLALLFVLALPYAFAPADYVGALNRAFLGLLTSMSVDPSGAFVAADFTAPFAALGSPLAEMPATVLRVAAALLTLLAVIWYDRNAEPGLAGLAIFLTAAFYMCVFNPRVESNTYAMLAMPCGLAVALIRREDGRGVLGLACASALFAAGFSGVTSGIHHALDLWFRPVILSAITLPVLAWLCIAARRPARAPELGAHV